MIVSWHKESGLLINVKTDPCMLENCFEGTEYRTPVANSGTVGP